MSSPQVEYQIDYSSKYSLHNWVQQYNLICSKDYLIGAIGSLYFAGWAALALVLPAKADKIGRKYVSCITLFITACSVTLLLFGT